MRLTSQAVDDLMRRCLWFAGTQSDGMINVEGIKANYAFSTSRIAEHADEIGALLAELPDEFHADKGGGWSFLNACNDRHDNQWTGLHSQMEKLFALGIAAGKARWSLPRELWSACRGEMPYVTVNQYG